ncbi:hypothetical protein COCSADRAFT_39176 [Bipolaris sorokiniana ND90Pr]|uniref:Uncharacterized protein n=1 Tax=Cochliobolus sativus (strain ND90Pr / ATCC 201652) TaxID=665912 RepID=M2S2M0_COCSN|nr:uncharacterized protein COCSADRAFT_39176 [Bipolaris sorokiniana ND90Pr]EMD61443.1 hypothetical protein COCSADRAFT_39176 [Bipolaris sorokiniana ND90Pr]
MSQASCNQVLALLGDLLPSTASRICSGTPHSSRTLLPCYPRVTAHPNRLAAHP